MGEQRNDFARVSFAADLLLPRRWGRRLGARRGWRRRRLPSLSAAPTKLAALAEHVRRDTSALATTSPMGDRTGVLPALMFCNDHQMFELRSAVQPTNSYDPLVVGSVQLN